MAPTSRTLPQHIAAEARRKSRHNTVLAWKAGHQQIKIYEIPFNHATFATEGQPRSQTWIRLQTAKAVRSELASSAYENAMAETQIVPLQCYLNKKLFQGHFTWKTPTLKNLPTLTPAPVETILPTTLMGRTQKQEKIRRTRTPADGQPAAIGALYVVAAALNVVLRVKLFV